MYKIALVEDEKNLNDLIKSYLEKENYEVVSFLNGHEALNNINQEFHLWILDIMLGDEISGYDLIKKIREIDHQVPVIFTSARDQELDKILGLELGSDDYVTKPYSPKELILRVNNIIKRVYNDNVNRIIYDEYIIDFDRRISSFENEEIELTNLEFNLLELLLKNKNKTLPRDTILNGVWGIGYYGTDRVVDDLIRRLRKKMPRLNIHTIYGYGYRLS